MPTNPVTYRVSPEVDAELKRLAKIHGGTDKALRILFEWNDPAVAAEPAKEITDKMQRSVDEMVTGSQKAVERQQLGRKFKGPIPRPKDKKKGLT